MAILCNKYDAVARSSTGGTGCLTLENVCVALAVDTLQASCSHFGIYHNTVEFEAVKLLCNTKIERTPYLTQCTIPEILVGTPNITGMSSTPSRPTVALP